jgi:hypothetical protein
VLCEGSKTVLGNGTLKYQQKLLKKFIIGAPPEGVVDR